MICPAGQGRNLSETNEKRVIHEDTRRITKGHEAGRLCRIDTAVARQPDPRSRVGFLCIDV